MIKLELTFATLDDTLEAVTRLAGLNVQTSIGGDAAAPKKETPTAKAKKATEDAFAAPAAEGKGKKGGKKKDRATYQEEVKKKILKASEDFEDGKQMVKDYVASFGVASLSDMTDEQLQAADDGVEDYFAVDESDEAEEDPMA